MKELLFVFFCLTSFFTNAQNKQKVDSLTQLVLHVKTQDTTKIKAYNDLGIQYAPSDPELARKYINKALDLAIQIDLERGKAGAYNCLGIVDYYQKDYDSALFHFEKAYKVNVKLEHLWGQAAALNQIGAVQNLKEDYNAAISNFKKSGEIFRIQNDSVALAKSIQNIGLSYSRMAYHQKAIEYYLKANQLYEKMNNAEGMGRTYFGIGTILNKQKEYPEALEYFNIALPKVKEVGNKILLGSVLKNIGISYKGLKDYNKALGYFQEALEYNKLVNNKKTVSSTQSSIGNTYYDMKLYSKALKYQKEALQNYGLIRKSKEKAFIQNSISKTLVKLNKSSEATDYAYKALELSKNLGNLENQKEAFHTLAMIAKQQGKNEKALQLYTNFQKLNDSLLTQQNQEQVRKLRTIYETDKNELQIESQKKDIASLHTQNKLKNQWLLFGSAGLLSVFGFILILKSREKVKKDKKVQERFTQELILAQENERTRVSKDLHDSVGQQLTFIKKKAQNLEQIELSSLANTALEEVRSISRDLYPATLKQLGLTESIEQLLFDLDGETEMFFSVEIDDINTSFNDTETLNFYRFIQESVNNVLKHSLAKTLIVNVVKGKNAIEVLIKDNGQGFQTSKSMLQNSLGLKTMEERIRILKGSLSIKSKKEVGTTILVKIPV